MKHHPFFAAKASFIYLVFVSLFSVSLEAAEQSGDPASQLAFLLESTFRSNNNAEKPATNQQTIRLSMQQESGKMPSEWLYSQSSSGGDLKTNQQQLIRLMSIDEQSVVQKSYQPKDLAKWLNAWNKPEVIQSFSSDDFEPSFDNSCDLRWSLQSKNDWRGVIEAETCKSDSQEILLSLSGLSKTVVKAAATNTSPSVSNRSTIVLQRVHNSSASLLKYSAPSDWRKPNPENLMLLQMPGGEVLFELSPTFAPNHVTNIRKLVDDGFFNGSQVIRSQDNYVAQWGDAQAGTKQERSLRRAKKKLALELFRDNSEVGFMQIDSRDAYAEQTGFAAGMPVSSDGKIAWMTHCYGMLGVGRGGEADSGNGSSLYMVNGHAPRHLDRNVTLVGRAISGMGVLSSLPRGTGPLGFYETDAEYAPISKVIMGADMSEQQLNIEVFRTDTDAFKRYVALRTTRNETWFLHPTGKIEICNVSVPTRAIELEAELEQ